MVRLIKIYLSFIILILASSSALQTAAFDDVTSEYWAVNYILYLDSMEIMSGYNDDTFGPEGNLTRAETVKIVLESTETDIVNTSKSSFPDVNSNHSLINYIETANRNNIVGGYEDGTFRPDQPVTRSEFTKILLETVDKVNQKVSMDPAFSDVDENEWYAVYIYSARELNYLSGYSDNTFKPNRKITRAESSKIIYKYLEGEDYIFPILSYEENKVLDLINQSREDAGKSPLVMNQKLSRIAREQSQALFDVYHFWTEDVKNQYLEEHPGEEIPWTSHKDPNSNEDFEDRFQNSADRYNTNFYKAGENIGFASWNNNSVDDQLVAIHEAMMAEIDNQAANILSKDIPYTEVGIGIVIGEEPNEIYVTQNFISVR